MLNLSLAVYEAITPRKNSQNLMTLLCVTQLNRQHWVFIKKNTFALANQDTRVMEEHALVS